MAICIRLGSTANRQTSVLECWEQLKRVGLLFVMIDEEHRLVRCDQYIGNGPLLVVGCDLHRFVQYAVDQSQHCGLERFSILPLLLLQVPEPNEVVDLCYV